MKRSAIVWGGFGALVLLGAGALTGCPSFGSSECDNGNCDGADAAGGDASNGDGSPSITDGMVNPMEGGNPLDAPADCKLAMDPKDSLPCVEEGVGVFVDSGSTAAAPDGTRKAPYKTISDAVSSNKRPRVYVCKGTYGENVKLDATHAESVYGGFDCATWKYDVSNGVKVQPTSGFALQIDTVTAAIQIEDVEFDAPAGTATEVSSVAAFMKKSSAVTLKRDTFLAAGGFSPTKPASPATNYNGNTALTLNGKTAADANGGGANPISCGDATTSNGGKGANGAGGQPAAGTPSYAAGGGVAGMNAVTCGGGGMSANADGDNATASAANAAPAKVGAIDMTSGWTPSTGTKGSNGKPGQGGGGGGNGKDNLGGGGGAAAGGCGGTGALGGGGGGGSIALLLIDSPATLVACTVTSGQAGTGAAGADAEGGQKGGAVGGSGYTDGVHGVGCMGGAGGAGAGGNGGGGGAAGVSFGILSSGGVPVVGGDSTVTAGTEGGVGAAGAAGPAAAGGTPGNAGAVGSTVAAAATKRVEDL